jgi:hypothetical protein
VEAQLGARSALNNVVGGAIQMSGKFVPCGIEAIRTTVGGTAASLVCGTATQMPGSISRAGAVADLRDLPQVGDTEHAEIWHFAVEDGASFSLETIVSAVRLHSKK